MFAALPRWEPKRYTSCLVGWNVIDAFARCCSSPTKPARFRDALHANTFMISTGRETSWPANAGFADSERYRYACEIDQRMRN